MYRELGVKIFGNIAIIFIYYTQEGRYARNFCKLVRHYLGNPAYSIGHLEEPVIASEAKQFMSHNLLKVRNFLAAVAPRNDRGQRALRGVLSHFRQRSAAAGRMTV